MGLLVFVMAFMVGKPVFGENKTWHKEMSGLPKIAYPIMATSLSALTLCFLWDQVKP